MGDQCISPGYWRWGFRRESLWCSLDTCHALGSPSEKAALGLPTLAPAKRQLANSPLSACRRWETSKVNVKLFLVSLAVDSCQIAFLLRRLLLWQVAVNPPKRSPAGGVGQHVTVLGCSASQKPSLEHPQSTSQGVRSEAITWGLPSRKTLFQQRCRILCPLDTG